MSLIELNELRKRVVLWPAVVAVLCLCAVVRAQNAPVELIVRKDRSNSVYSVVFSPDGKTLASGGYQAILWDAGSGQRIRALSGSADSVAFSPDGKALALGGWDKTIRLWDVSSGQLIRALSGHSSNVTCVAFSPDGKVLASGGWDKTIRLWDVSSGQLISTLSGHSNAVTSIAFSPDGNALASGSGRALASGSFDNTIKLWNASSGQLIRTLTEHSYDVKFVAFSPDGKTLVSRGDDKTIRLWNASSGQLIRALTGHSEDVNAVAFSPDGKALASGGWDAAIKLWDVSSGQIIRTFSGYFSYVNALAFSPDGKALTSSDGTEGIRVWSTETGKLVVTYTSFGDDWITYTRDNYYICSAGAVKYILWAQRDKIYDHSAFSAQFNKPEIVAERLRSIGTEPTTTAVTPLSSNTNTTTANIETPKPPAPKDISPPKVVIISPQLARGQGVKPAADRILKKSASSLTVAGQATDESGVREVTVRGVAARLDERGNFSAEVPLQVGDNPITVTATDNYGNRATESFTVRRESEPPPVAGRYFALVIGNNRYPNLPPERQLKTAINDAQEVAQLLHADYGFEIKLLTDAGREKIIDALNEYRSRSNPDDKLLIYYAGHGHFDDDTKKAYWIPADAKLSSPANWIIADDVTSGIKAIPARHILIVSDSCYSGTLTRATDPRLNTPAERERYLEKMRGGISRSLMASGGNEPVADGGGSGHSVFARALLDGLRGMSERVFTAEELFHEYIKQRVAGKSEQTPEYNPLHNSGHEAGDFVFVRVR